VERLPYRKVNKALGRHPAVIADQKQKIEVLKVQVGHLRPKKKKKAKLGNNERFANIVAIRNTYPCCFYVILRPSGNHHLHINS
jgi:hypothetical protein